MDRCSFISLGRGILLFPSDISCLYIWIRSQQQTDRGRDFLIRIWTHYNTISLHVPFLAPPPNPAVPITLLRAVSHASNDKSSAHPTTELDDDFGDFQMAGWIKIKVGLKLNRRTINLSRSIFYTSPVFGNARAAFCTYITSSRAIVFSLKLLANGFKDQGSLFCKWTISLLWTPWVWTKVLSTLRSSNSVVFNPKYCSRASLPHILTHPYDLSMDPRKT